MIAFIRLTLLSLLLASQVWAQPAPTMYMEIEKPTPGVTSGPEWAQMLNAAFDKIDMHDHSTGSGKKVTQSGINITDDFELNSNSIKEVKSVDLESQGGALAGSNRVYAQSGDLYYKDGSGAAVQITSGGAVASSISGAFASKTPGAYPYTIVSGDAQRVLLVDTTAARTINLPAATTAILVMVKDISGSALTNNISLVPNGLDQIDGVNATRRLAENYGWWTLISDGVSKWSIGTMRDTAIPVGSMQMYGGSTAPAGWLMCDGSAVSRTTYAGLFSAIGTAYGAGDAATTFNLPNFAQKFPLGKSSSGVGVNLGDTGGAIAQTATVPGHHHGMGAGADLAISSSGSHAHTIDHDHGAGSTGSAGAHVHDISHGHTASSASAGGHFHHMMVDANVTSGGSPSATDKGFVRSFDGTNDFSYDLKSNNVEPGAARTSEVSGHTHDITVNSFSGNSESAGAHTHTATVPAHSGNSGASSHTHGSGDITGRIGKVTAGSDGNSDISAGVSSAPYLTVNFIIKF